MAAAQKNNKSLETRVFELEFTQNKIILPQLAKHDQYIEASKPGIRFSTLLESRVTTILIAAAAGGIILLAAKAIGNL